MHDPGIVNITLLHDALTSDHFLIGPFPIFSG
jgi:hypothetical protein